MRRIFWVLFQKKHSGVFGDVSTFSFYGNKTLTTGEGGMVTTGDQGLAKKIRRLRDHGAETTDLQRHLGSRPYLLTDHTVAGYNQRMTDIQGALGAAQMKRASEILEERRFLAKRYDVAFGELDWLSTPKVEDGYEHGYQSYPCLFNPTKVNNDSISLINSKRNSWMDKLQSDGISTRQATHAVHMLGYYQKYLDLKTDDFPGARDCDQNTMAIPLHNRMVEDDYEYIVKAISEIV